MFVVLGIAAAIAVSVAIELDLLDVPVRVPHAANPVLPFEPLPDVSFTGQYEVTHPLTADNVKRWLEGIVLGPEHMVYRSASISAGEVPTRSNEAQLPGVLWFSSTNGTLYKVELDAKAEMKPDSLEEMLYAGPGRVLGFAFDSRSGIYLCNSVHGLLHWSPNEGSLRLISNRVSHKSKLHPGKALHFVNSVTVSPVTGKVYFTTSGDIPPPYVGGVYDTKKASGLVALTGLRTGMVLEFDPATGDTTCLVDGMYFANGVDIATDGRYIVYVETFTSSIHKLWLAGPKAGSTEKLTGPLPAFVDNVQRVLGTDESFLSGFPAAASKALTMDITRSRIVRAMICLLPDSIRYKLAPKVGGAVQVSGSGLVERVIADPTGKAAHSTPTGVLLHVGSKSTIFFSSLENDFIVQATIS